MALAILSGIEPPDLVAALRDSDVARLTRVPGVGRKTAERLVLELRDKVQDLAAVVAPAPSAKAPSPLRTSSPPSSTSATRSPEAERAAEKALADHPDERFEDLLRFALQVVSRR